MNKKIVLSILIVLLIVFTYTTNCYAVTLPSLSISSNDYSKNDKLTLDEKNQIEVGETLQLYALIIHGNEMMVEDNPNSLGWFVDETDLEGVTWSSSNTNVAQVDSSGKVTGISKGTTTISAHYEKKDQDAEYEIEVTKSTKPRITTKQLSDAFQKYVQNYSDSSMDVNITVDDSTITFSSDEYSTDFVMNYDLTDSPTFTYAVDIQKGMGYDDYEEKTGMLTLPLLGYIAVANIQGAEFEDAAKYIMSCILYYALSNSSSAGGSYAIVDDGVTITDTDFKVIKKSEFGNYVLEYVDNMYKKNADINDSDVLDSFRWILEKQDDSADSRKLVSTLTVNLDADFAKLAEYHREPQDYPLPTPTYKNGYSQEDPNKQPTVLPKAGISLIIIITTIILLFIALGIKIKLNKYKEIK